MRLKALREKRKETQEDVSRSIGISLSMYQKLEQGKKHASDSLKIKLASHYGVSVGYLFFDEPITLSDKSALM